MQINQEETRPKSIFLWSKNFLKEDFWLKTLLISIN